MAEFSKERGNPGEWDQTKKELTIKQTRQLPPELSDVSISLTGGRVDIHGGKRLIPILTTGLFIRGNTEDEARASLERKQGELMVIVEGNRLVIDGTNETETDQRVIENIRDAWPDVLPGQVPEEGKPLMRRDVDLLVPESGISYDIKTKTANSALEEVSGEAEVSSEFGHVYVGRYDGKISIQTKNGDISGEDVTAILRAKTAGGDVFLTDFDGEARIGTLLGSVLVDRANFSGPDNEITTGFGKIEVKTTNESLTVEANGKLGKIELPRDGFTVTNDELVRHDGKPEKFIQGYFGDGTTDSNYLFLRNNEGGIVFEKARDE